MKNLKYRYKYLLYESPSHRFSDKEAAYLADTPYEQELLFTDLKTRSQAYRNKVKVNFEQHPETLSGLIRRIERMPAPKKHKPKKPKSETKTKTHSEPAITSSLRDVTRFRFTWVVQGGAPGLGKKS